MRRIFLFASCLWLLVGSSLLALARTSTSPVSVTVEPKEAFIERRGTQQIVNFVLLRRNAGTVPVRINKIQVSVYDASGALAFRRYLDENGRPSGISSVP